MDLQELQASVELALDMVAADTTIRAAEVCVSWCEQQAVQVHYDDAQSQDVVQTPQACTNVGVGILVVVDAEDGRWVGFGSEEEDVSPESLKQAIERAKASTEPAPAFVALPTPVVPQTGLLTFHDPEVSTLSPDTLVSLAHEALDGALTTFKEAGFVTHLQVRGQLCSRTERLVIGNTHGLLAGDTSTGLAATLYACLPREQSHGTGSGAATHVTDLAAYEVGVAAAQGALQGRGSIRLDAGDYTVVLAPQAVAALLEDLLLPALSLDVVAADASPFAAHFGQQVASPLLTLTDEGRLPRHLGSHIITGDGLPTGTTPLLEQGRLVGFLADFYHAQALARRFPHLTPHNGMRYASNGQSYSMRPGIFPTNVRLTSDAAVTLDTLLAPIADGIYVGGLWHTVPQGERRRGDFISTVLGPSFHIQNGKLGRPLRPATLHVQDNLHHFLQGITGLASERQQVVLSTLQSLVFTPAVRCRQLRFVS
jgi:predicted Zn-dependent protease